MPARMPSTAFGGCVAENRSSVMRLPRVVAAEPPQVAFDVAAGVAASAVVLVGDVHDDGGAGGLRLRVVCVGVGDRSEEHTSELQSLMRISYAVFCLKKKHTYQTNTNQQCKTELLP